MQPPPQQDLLRSRRRHRPPRSWLIAAGILGVITTAVMAVLAAGFFPNARGWNSITVPGRSWAYSPGWSQYESWMPSIEGAHGRVARRVYAACRADSYRLGWFWPEEAVPRRGTFIIIEAWGWPARSFWGWRIYEPAGVIARGDLMEILAPGSADAGRRIIPVAPRWPQLATNTVVLGSPWLGLFAAVRGARRWRRRRRGRCPGCAYERRGLAGDARCPECGEEAPRAATRSA